MGRKHYQTGVSPNRGGWGGGGGSTPTMMWADRYFPASEFLPCTDVTGAAAPTPIGYELAVSGGEVQGGSALQFQPPGANIVRGLATWVAPFNFDNTDLPWMQLYFTVDQDGAIGDSRIDWWVGYYPFEDQYVLDVTTPIFADAGRNVLSPPAPTPSQRIYFSPEVQVTPSDPEGYLDPNLFWTIVVQRGGYAPIADDFTGNAMLLGMRLRYRLTI